MSAQPQIADLQLALTGVGLVTSVGRGRTALAAVRAGLSRPSALAFAALDEEGLDEQPVTGHPVTGLTEGFSPLARWLQLGRTACVDLFESVDLPSPSDRTFWSTTGLVGALPQTNSPRFENEDGQPDAARQAFLGPLQRSLGLGLPDQGIGCICHGHTSAAEAFQAAGAAIASGRAKRVLLLAVDSYLDDFTLQWLASEHRLKTSEEPTGLSPGEAAACFLLEPLQEARRRRAPVLAVVTTVVVASAGSTARTVQGGRALAGCIRAALSAGSTARFDGLLVSDLNGESWRAEQWGMSLTNLSDLLGPIRLHLPATSLGDTGASSGLVGIALAAHVLARITDSPGRAIVLSSSDDGTVACTGVERGRP